MYISLNLSSHIIIIEKKISYLTKKTKNLIHQFDINLTITLKLNYYYYNIFIKQITKIYKRFQKNMPPYAILAQMIHNMLLNCAENEIEKPRGHYI